MSDTNGPVAAPAKWGPDDALCARRKTALLALLASCKMTPGGVDFVLPGSSPDEVMLEKKLIKIFGHDPKTGWIFGFCVEHSRNVVIRNIGNYKYAILIRDFGGGLRKTVVRGGESLQVGIHTFNDVADAISAVAAMKCIKPEDFKSRGVWELGDGRLVLVGTNHLAIYDNGTIEITKEAVLNDKLFELSGEDPWFDDKELRQNVDDSADPQWCADVMNELVAAFTPFDNLSRAGDPELLAALAAASWLQTVWEIRPVVVLTGPSNSGKSMMFKQVLSPFFGNLGLDIDSPTEAGLRQEIGESASIPMVDEFDNSPRRPDILKTIRTTTRQTRGRKKGGVLKGGAGGTPRKYSMNCIPWLGSIESGLRDAADKNRSIRIELTEVKNLSQSGRTLMVAPDPEQMRALGQQVLAVMLRYWKQIKAEAARLCQVVTQTVETKQHREVECLALPAAVLSVILGKTPTESEDILRGFLTARADLQVDIEKDDEMLLKAIYTAQVDYKLSLTNVSSKEMIGTLIRRAIRDVPYNSDEDQDGGDVKKHLNLCGLRVCKDPKDKSGVQHPGRFLFAARDLVTSRLLRDTKWSSASGTQINEILSRIPGAFNGQAKFADKDAWGTFIPLDEVSKMEKRTDQEVGTPKSTLSLFE